MVRHLLSELAMRGVSKPENCKFPCIVAEVNVFEVIEIIPMSIQATQSIMMFQYGVNDMENVKSKKVFEHGYGCGFG